MIHDLNLVSDLTKMYLYTVVWALIALTLIYVHIAIIGFKVNFYNIWSVICSRILYVQESAL